MIKLIDILKEVEDLSIKDKLLKYLNSRIISTLQGTAENRLIKKLIKDIIALEDNDLRIYVSEMFSNRKNTWKLRIIAGNLLDIIDGKK
jgi:hypothetical protein